MTDEGGKPGVMGVVSGAVSALSVQPNLLLVFLLNAVFIGALFYYLIDERKGKQELVNKLFDHCFAQGRVP